MPRRDGALAALLVGALVATATLTSVLRPSNPTALPTGLAVAASVESSALYCTGLSDAAGGVEGAVDFLNTGLDARTVSVAIVSDTGRRAAATLEVAGHTRVSLAPDHLVDGHSFGVSAVVDGGGVVADEVTAAHSSVVPCAGAGVTSWYASGLDTTVGSSARLSFYNPTATPAVVNVTADTPGGFVAPAPFQGLPVAAHAEVTLDLNTQIVNTADVGVRVNVLRGELVVAGVENSLTVGSLDVGSVAPSTSAWFPRVTTADQATAQIRVANPGPGAVSVTAQVSLGSFHVPAQTTTIDPFASAVITVTPNSAIPAAGYAVVRLASSAPVVATLATGTGAGVALSPAPVAGALFFLADFGTGYDTATLTNTSDREVTVTFPHSFAIKTTSAASNTSSLVSFNLAPYRLAPLATVDLVTAAGGSATALSGSALGVGASRPVVVVTATLATTPPGLSVVVPSDGG